MKVLLTGGTGYIGSHTAVVLSAAGHEVVLYDNLRNSSALVIDRLETITGKRLPLIKGDIRDAALLTQTLKAHQIDAVVHFAGLKAVSESVAKPIEYYDNNVGGTISLPQAMQAIQATEVNTVVFSSSANVYGDPQYLPIDEEHPTRATNPYGCSKLHIEDMPADVVKTNGG